MKTPVGIDVSKDTLDVCILREGSKPLFGKFRNAASGHEELVAWVLARAQPEGLHFCLESTGCYGLGVASHLCARGLLVSVENPRPIRHFAIAMRLKLKTDKADAYCIARYCAAMEPRGWTPGDPLRRELAQTRARARQAAADRLAELARLEDERLPEFCRSQILAHAAFLAIQIDEARARIRALMSRCERARAVYLAVTGINGVGPEVGLLLATLDVESFEGAKAVPVHFGLNPTLRQSGRFCGRTRISKCGDAAGRAVLMGAACAAVKSNPVLRAFFDSLLARGLKRKQALAAVARKIAMVAWAVARNALRGLPVTYPGGELRGRNIRIYAPEP